METSTSPIRATRAALGKTGPPNRLREFRRLRGYEAKALAALLGIRISSLNEAERRRTGAIGRDKWLRIADILDVDPRILMRPAE